MNVLLLVAKAATFYLSNSKAVLASLSDSAVDLISQVKGRGGGRWPNYIDGGRPVFEGGGRPVFEGGGRPGFEGGGRYV